MAITKLEDNVANLDLIEHGLKIDNLFRDKQRNNGYYLNLGCGHDILTGYINIDMMELENVDLVLLLLLTLFVRTFIKFFAGRRNYPRPITVF